MNLIKAILRRFLSVIMALAVTLALFLVLPLMQAITEKEPDVYTVQEVNVTLEQPPPDVQEEEDDPPEDVEDPPQEPELDLEQPMMTDITQLDLLGGTGGFSIPSADTSINIDSAIGDSAGPDSLFDPGALDQRARVLFQAQPKITPQMRSRSPATVVVVFIVDPGGRVSNATVIKSTDSLFNTSAINAVKQWRFEPAQRGGKPVEARMRQAIEFPRPQ